MYNNQTIPFFRKMKEILILVVTLILQIKAQVSFSFNHFIDSWRNPQKDEAFIDVTNQNFKM